MFVFGAKTNSNIGVMCFCKGKNECFLGIFVGFSYAFNGFLGLLGVWP